MSRVFIDCREVPSASGCTVAMAADSEDELLEAAVQHAMAVHGEHDTPELRTEIRKAFHSGNPPEQAPGQSQAQQQARPQAPH
jgi:predicted small metal-binding protein